jgi:hypothetical protein
VCVACVEGLSSVVGTGFDVGPDDAAILASLARARFVVPAFDDAKPSFVGRAFLKRELDRVREDGVPWPTGAPRRVVVEPGVWYRVAPE